jgi:hypothetical protein
MASPTLKFKRGSYSQLPTLAIGEPGFTTDRNQLFIGSPSGNQLIGGGEFWNLNSTTTGGGIKLYEGTNNGTNYVELQAPDSLAANLELTLPSVDASTSGQVLQSNASGVLSFGDVALTAIDIDGGTDIGADITDTDLFIVDDGAGGTNRKTAASRIKSYVLGGGGSGGVFDTVTVATNQRIDSSGINVVGVITASDGFVGDVTGNADTSDQVKTESTATDATHFLTFVDSNNGTAANETIYTDGGITYNPSSNSLNAGAVNAVILSINGSDITATAAEINRLDGLTLGEVTAGKVLTVDSNKNIQTLGVVTATTFSGDLTGNVTGNADTATTATNSTITANNTTDETVYPVFVDGATGSQGLESDTGLNYNPSTGNLTSVTFTGNVTGDLTGTIQTASQTNITSVGTLGSLDVTNNITVGGTVDGRDVLDDGQAGDNLVTLTGVARDATDLGTFTGSTIADNETIKGALQDLETELETIAGGGAQATSIAVGATDTNATHYLTFVADNNTSPTQETVKTDAGVSYNPSTNIMTVGEVSVTTLDIGGTNVTATATELNVLDGVTAFLDEDNLASDSATAIPSQQSVKAYVDTSVSGVAVTFAVAGDSGSGIVTTGTTLTVQGTSNEVDTSVSNNVVTIGLPNTVNITTELNVPTVDVGALRASDGTAAITITDSTGKVTTSTDHEVQGTFTAASGTVLQGDTDIGDQTSDTITFLARADSDFVPATDSTHNLGTNSLRWLRANVDEVVGTSINVSGTSTATTYKGASIDLTAGGTFGGNLVVSGNLSVGGSITSVDVEDLRIISPVVELGLEDNGSGELQPPANQTQYNSGVVMYYNHVGVSSANAKAAAMFAAVRLNGNMRIGFATDVTIVRSGAGDSVSTVNNWADIEAKGLWINDCAGQSVVINCSGSERFLNNIIVDGGTFV